MIVFLMYIPANNASTKVYLDQDSFLTLIKSLEPHKGEVQFQTKTLWLDKYTQGKIKKILNHNYPRLRLRYKINTGIPPNSDLTTVWFLDEIGKERPISFGIAVKNDKVQLIRVLEFRESRGFEIKNSAFTKQFEHVGLDGDGKLDQSIDGITGATMSVRAMKKISRIALFLHKKIISEANSNKNTQ